MRDGDSGVSNAQDSIIGQKLPQNLFRPSHHLRSSKRDSYSLFNTRISLCIIGLIRKWLYRHLGMRTASRRRPCWNAPCCLLADLISFLASTSSGFKLTPKVFCCYSPSESHGYRRSSLAFVCRPTTKVS